MLKIVNIYMEAKKEIPVTDRVWQKLSQLKRVDQTYDELLEEMIEEHKKARLFEEMHSIEERGDFVELK